MKAPDGSGGSVVSRRARRAALLSLALASACMRDVWTYAPRADAGAEAAVDAPINDAPADAGPDPGCDPAAPTRCGETCVDPRSSVDHCGACGRQCFPEQRCAEGVCACPVGKPAEGACSAEATPRPLAPLSLGDVTQRRPTLRWALPARFDETVVELCRDRACASVIETLTVTATFARPTGEFAPRSVVFWRLRGRAQGTTDAAYGPTWLFHVPAVGARTGVDTSANPHCDVNADGYDDLVVGALNADPDTSGAVGTASVYHGGPSGIERTAARVFKGAVAAGHFGASVACAGDLDGDGYADLVVGAPTATHGGRYQTGTVSVYHGGPSGIAEARVSFLQGPAPGSYLGSSAHGAGDVNGDGYGDLIVGVNGVASGGAFNSGAVFVYHGTPSGIAAPATRVLEGIGVESAFGFSSAGAGDVNGDGYSDVVVGSVHASPSGRVRAGRASVFHGGPTGVSATAAWSVNGRVPEDHFGISVASAGDVNGDGYSDVVVGASGDDVRELRDDGGAVSVYHGSAEGIVAGAEAARRLEGLAAGEQFGESVSSAGDVNGDGFADLVVGAPYTSPGGRTRAGSARVFHGSVSGIAGEAARVLEGPATGGTFGQSVAGIGDVNGDGFADVAVGAPFNTPGRPEDAGSARVFHGSTAGVAGTASSELQGDDGGDGYGYSVASVNGGGGAEVADRPRPAPSVYRRGRGRQLLCRRAPQTTGLTSIFR